VSHSTLIWLFWNNQFLSEKSLLNIGLEFLVLGAVCH
jgi:hypothetical protein